MAHVGCTEPLCSAETKVIYFIYVVVQKFENCTVVRIYASVVVFVLQSITLLYTLLEMFTATDRYRDRERPMCVFGAYVGYIVNIFELILCISPVIMKICCCFVEYEELYAEDQDGCCMTRATAWDSDLFIEFSVAL